MGIEDNFKWSNLCMGMIDWCGTWNVHLEKFFTVKKVRRSEGSELRGTLLWKFVRLDLWCFRTVRHPLKLAVKSSEQRTHFQKCCNPWDIFEAKDGFCRIWYSELSDYCNQLLRLLVKRYSWQTLEALRRNPSMWLLSYYKKF